jgi:hypothetical protein
MYCGVTAEKFNELYNDFHSIYTGEKYSKFVNNNFHNISAFINSIKEQSQSFRSFILKLCRDTFMELNKDGYYKNKFYNSMNKGVIKEQYANKSDHKWPDKMAVHKYPNTYPDFLNLTNDQLLCLYQYVFPHTKTDIDLEKGENPVITNTEIASIDPVEETKDSPDKENPDKEKFDNIR